MPRSDEARSGREVYTFQGNAAFEAHVAMRTASRSGSHLLPHLRPGMRVLDAGCGPGTITIGLAEVVAPGEVVGVDFQPEQVEQARSLAAERGVPNARFEVANVYELPFPDGSFDAAFANSLLVNLREPVRALREIRRVLGPDGIVGVSEPDFATQVIAPATPLLEQSLALIYRAMQHNGVNPHLGRHHRRLLLEAGFARAEAMASANSSGSLAACRQLAAFRRAQLQSAGRTALAEGWVDLATLDVMAQEIDAWSERPDAFHALVVCQAIGWVRAEG
jgi:ubiquinone/menaquinone biosynthesis C-methylase UbiE